MMKMTLGRTGLTVNRNGFGALPVQRVTKEEGARLLRMAYDGGIDFFDTARAYSDSEEKIGLGLSDVRERIILATKTGQTTAEGFWKDLETSLSLLKTDHVDIYQFHNPAFCPKPGDGTGLYEAMLEAKKQGKIRFICMKALSGGLITRSDAAYAYLAQFPNTLPIWGIQRESELREFLSYQDNPPAMTEELRALIEADRKELAGDFCRGCGYCMPCPQGIEINTCARMSLLLRRSPAANWLSERGQAMMKKVEDCVGCGQCKSRCPYNLDTPALLRRNYEDYKTFLK